MLISANSGRGCRITAITLAFQARDEGSTPFTRSKKNASHDARLFLFLRQDLVSPLLHDGPALLKQVRALIGAKYFVAVDMGE